MVYNPTAALYCSIAVINAMSIVVWASTGFGNAIFFHIGWHICLLASQGDICEDNVPLIVMYITFSGILVYPLQLWRLRRFINWPLALNFGIAQVIGVVIGSYVLFSYSSIWIIRVLAIILYTAAIQKAYGMLEKRYKGTDAPTNSRASFMGSTVMNIPKPPSLDQIPAPDDTAFEFRETEVMVLPPSQTDFVPYVVKGWGRVAVYGAGVFSGITSGLLGTGGPVLIWFATLTNLAPLECRSTFSFGNSVEALARLIYIFFLQDTLHHVKSGDNMIMFFLIALTSVIFFVVGNQVALYISLQNFHIILLFMLAIGSLMIGITGIDIVNSLIVIAIAIAVAVCCIYASMWFYLWRHEVLTDDTPLSSPHARLLVWLKTPISGKKTRPNTVSNGGGTGDSDMGSSAGSSDDNAGGVRASHSRAPDGIDQRPSEARGSTNNPILSVLTHLPFSNTNDPDARRL